MNKGSIAVTAIVEFTEAFAKFMDQEGVGMDAEDLLPSFQAGWLGGIKFARDILEQETGK